MTNGSLRSWAGGGMTDGQKWLEKGTRTILKIWPDTSKAKNVETYRCEKCGYLENYAP